MRKRFLSSERDRMPAFESCLMPRLSMSCSNWSSRLVSSVSKVMPSAWGDEIFKVLRSGELLIDIGSETIRDRDGRFESGLGDLVKAGSGLAGAQESKSDDRRDPVLVVRVLGLAVSN